MSRRRRENSFIHYVYAMLNKQDFNLAAQGLLKGFTGHTFVLIAIR